MIEKYGGTSPFLPWRGITDGIPGAPFGANKFHNLGKPNGFSKTEFVELLFSGFGQLISDPFMYWILVQKTQGGNLVPDQAIPSVYMFETVMRLDHAIAALADYSPHSARWSPRNSSKMHELLPTIMRFEYRNPNDSWTGHLKRWWNDEARRWDSRKSSIPLVIFRERRLAVLLAMRAAFCALAMQDAGSAGGWALMNSRTGALNVDMSTLTALAYMA